MKGSIFTKQMTFFSYKEIFCESVDIKEPQMTVLWCKIHAFFKKGRKIEEKI